MKKFLMLLLCSITLFAVTESKEGSKRYYTHTVKKILGSAQSLDGARYSAVEGAKQEILEFAGSYMETQSEIVDGKLTKDEILAVTNGVIKTEVIKEQKSFEGDAIAITVTVRCELETDGLQKRIEKLLGNKELKTQNEDLVKKNRVLLAKIASLEEQSTKATSKKEKKKIEEEFRETDKRAKAIEYFEESLQYASADRSKAENPKKMITLLDKALELDPKLAMAYNNRGFAYSDLKNYNQAIKDFTKAIDLDSSLVLAYHYRGYMYANFQNYDQAIKDFTKAIDLDPSYIGAYNNRGLVYFVSGDNYNGCKDANSACNLGSCELLEEAKNKGSCQ